MLKRALGSRGFMSAVVVITLVGASMIGWQFAKPTPEMRVYCAQMPDAIGLYEGSAVAIMGVPVGRVTHIEPDGASARVRFTVPAERKLPPDVGAVTVSDTLIADRKLALIGAEPRGPGWNSEKCITKTLTPKSLSETLDALAQLGHQLNGSGQPGQAGALGAGLDALNRATTGSGEEINTLVRQLGTALSAPDAAIGHIGKLLDALTELTHRARGGWPTVETTITGLTQTFVDINTLEFPQIVRVVASLADVLPQLNDVVMMFGSPALRAIDSIPNLPQMLSAGVGSVSDVIEMTPAIAAGFAESIDESSGRMTIGYAPPQLALPPPVGTQVCAAVESITGQRCGTGENGAVTVPSIPAILAAVSAR
ncbi:MCE family protein [Nocardia cyriacigeorgica]|uniref:MCE family protein n=1 Tax=Nocardia cyriacigeorgica TaxID=135487 RepID=A0A5R8PAC1_9NOCA|nr:MlaD family protein [Nocardia cyriacigeorgica]TLG05293.1 MCE family protein [Nocardia cyriacigeorgica]